ncbi:MAG: four helix bundle suffix domain-containing protein [Anaerohalosphaeraceae bacterium]
MTEHEELIPKHGGYRKLKSFQLAQLIYDVTVRFCQRYVDSFGRMRDQMIQAARSGVQNIAEGSQASATSKKTELKLTSVARASLEELRLDYEDYLRQRGLSQWKQDDPRRTDLIARRLARVEDVASWVKQVYKNGRSGRHGQSGQKKQDNSSMMSMQSMSSTYSEIAANAGLTLIAVACHLLDRQLAALAKAFEQEGGFTERLYRVRQNSRISRGNQRS